MHTTDWRTRAACLDEDPELFFPTGEEHTSTRQPTAPVLAQFAEAKTVCQRCPVTTTCLTWAIANRVRFGVFGGMTPDERHAHARALTRAS